MYIPGISTLNDTNYMNGNDISDDSIPVNYDDSLSHPTNKILSTPTFINTETVQICNVASNVCIDPNVILSDLRKRNVGRLIIGHLNINSFHNKFQALKGLFKGKLDILCVSEIKIDESFPTSQFFKEGFSTPFRLDRNHEIIIYVREDIPCKELKNHYLPNDVEGIFIESTLRNKKWILFGGYNCKKELSSYFLNHIGQSLDRFIGNYDNLLLMGDFNSEVEEKIMREFCDTYNLENLIKEPTCFKSAQNPTTIDLILTNRYRSLLNSFAIETGISDHHKMTVTVLKTYFKKLKYHKIPRLQKN